MSQKMKSVDTPPGTRRALPGHFEFMCRTIDVIDGNEVVWIAVHMKQDVALSDVKPMRMEFGDTNASLLQDVMLNIIELTPCSLKE